MRPPRAANTRCEAPGDIARLQKAIYEKLAATRLPRPDISVLLPHFPPLLSLVKCVGPSPLARMAEELAQDPAQWRLLLMDENIEEGKAFYAWALLQPYFEYQASQSDISTGVVQRSCPFCGEHPQVAVLRGEGDGGKRSLICRKS